MPDRPSELLPHQLATLMLTFFDYLPSQNAFKVRLLLSHLRLPHDTKIISIFEGAGKSVEYRKISPTGAVPAILLDDGCAVAESNAILTYLSEGTPYRFCRNSSVLARKGARRGRWSERQAVELSSG